MRSAWFQPDKTRSVFSASSAWEKLPSAPDIKINMVSVVREAELHVGFLNLHQKGKDQRKTALLFHNNSGVEGAWVDGEEDGQGHISVTATSLIPPPRLDRKRQGLTLCLSQQGCRHISCPAAGLGTAFISLWEGIIKFAGILWACCSTRPWLKTDSRKLTVNELY